MDHYKIQMIIAGVAFILLSAWLIKELKNLFPSLTEPNDSDDPYDTEDQDVQEDSEYAEDSEDSEYSEGQPETTATDNSIGTTETNETTENTEPDMKSGTYKEYANSNPNVRAILFGLNKCDPYVYQGDTLQLRGCINDSRNTLAMLRKTMNVGRVWYNTDEHCNIANFIRVWKEATKDIKPGDTLIYQRSGHGTSLGENVLDKIGDEEISRGEYSGDQAAILYDGVVVDDCFNRLLQELPKGVKVIFINDSCFSATQYRVANIPVKLKVRATYRKAKFVPKEYLPGKDNMLDLKQLSNEFGFKGPKSDKLDCDLISISGCQDFETSADAYVAGKYTGAMTYALLTAVKENPVATPKQLQSRLLELCAQGGYDQHPQINIEGSPELWDKPLFA